MAFHEDDDAKKDSVLSDDALEEVLEKDEDEDEDAPAPEILDDEKAWE